MGKIEIKESFIKNYFCEKMNQYIPICHQYFPMLKQYGTPYCNFDGCIYTDCHYHKEEKKI